jgi:hypothetical protein
MRRMALVLALGALGMGCGELERSNPYDTTRSGGIVDLREELVGAWSREDVEKNEVYAFKADGRVELRDFSSPGGGPVDRNASYPQTLVLSFTGTYVLVGDLLRITFTDVQSNDPSGSKPLLRDKVVNILIQGNRLTMKEADGERVYARL